MFGVEETEQIQVGIVARVSLRRQQRSRSKQEETGRKVQRNDRRARQRGETDSVGMRVSQFPCLAGFSGLCATVSQLCVFQTEKRCSVSGGNMHCETRRQTCGSSERQRRQPQSHRRSFVVLDSNTQVCFVYDAKAKPLCLSPGPTRTDDHCS